MKDRTTTNQVTKILLTHIQLSYFVFFFLKGRDQRINLLMRKCILSQVHIPDYSIDLDSLYLLYFFYISQERFLLLPRVSYPILHEGRCFQAPTLGYARNHSSMWLLALFITLLRVIGIGTENLTIKHSFS